jgi:phage protein D
VSLAADPIPVYQGSDFYVPAFEVVLGGRDQSAAVLRDVTQVSYKDSTGDVDSFELTVNNWDAGRRKFKYHDRSLFNPGKDVELRMGYLGAKGGGVRTMLRGKIDGLRPAFPAGGQPTLTVTVLNVLHQFRKEQRSDRYENKTYAEIAQVVCGRLGVTLDKRTAALLPSIRHPSVMQENEYDVVFLMRLARQAGCELVAAEAGSQTVLMFGPPALSARPTYRLSYGRSLIEFQPTLSFANQVSEVVVLGFNQQTGQKIDVSVKADLRGTKLPAGTPNPAEGRKEVVSNRPVRDEQSARELAQAVLAQIQNEAVTATGSVVGLPDLRAGAQVHVDGLGRRFNGQYYVTATTHTLGSGGYTTQFECRLEVLSGTDAGEALADGGGP